MSPVLLVAELLYCVFTDPIPTRCQGQLLLPPDKHLCSALLPPECGVALQSRMHWDLSEYDISGQSDSSRHCSYRGGGGVGTGIHKVMYSLNSTRGNEAVFILGFVYLLEVDFPPLT